MLQVVTFVEINTEKGIKLLQNALDTGAIKLEKASEKGIMMRSKVNDLMLNQSRKWNDKLLPPLDDRIQYYLDALEHCIDCGACRTICPVCACEDASKCTRYHMREDSYKMSMYHLIRFLHVADSCIGCGQCTDICPSEIPLAHLQQRFSRRIQEKYNYKPGMDDKRPPFFEVK